MPDAQPITARLAAAGSRRTEMEALLAAARDGATAAELRALVLECNITRKASTVSRQKVWTQLRQRYLLDIATSEYLSFLEGMRETTTPRERGLLCFLMLARTDRTFREICLDYMCTALQESGRAIEAQAVDEYLVVLTERYGLVWSGETKAMVRKHALSALKDFGLLTGSARKQTVRPQLGPETVLFAARLARLEGLTDRQVLGARWYRLLGLNEHHVIDLLYASARNGALNFRMQADVVELEMPALPVP